MYRVFYFFVLAFILVTPAHANDDQKLYLYTWDTYVAPDLFKKFEQETGIKVITDIYSNNDTLVSKLKSGAAYDIVMPSGNYIQAMIQDNLLLPIPDDLRNRFVPTLGVYVQNPPHDPEYKHSLPYFFGTTGIVANKKLLKNNVPTTWQEFFNRPDDEAPSIGILDDIATAMNIGSLALKTDYCAAESKTLQSLQSLFLQQKPFVKVFGSSGYTERMVAGEVALQMAWSCDAYRARQDNPDLVYIYPTEGVEIWVDSLAIPAKAKNIEGAKKFIAFMMRPENMAEAAIVSGNIPSVASAITLLPETMQQAPEFKIPDTVNTQIAKSCPSPVIRSYNKIWERLMR